MVNRIAKDNNIELKNYVVSFLPEKTKEHNERDSQHTTKINPTGNFSDLHHIAIIISTEEAIRFYEKLNFKELDRMDRGYDIVIMMEGRERGSKHSTYLKDLDSVSCKQPNT